MEARLSTPTSGADSRAGFNFPAPMEAAACESPIRGSVRARACQLKEMRVGRREVRQYYYIMGNRRRSGDYFKHVVAADDLEYMRNRLER